jgi:MFS family permease
LRSRPLPLASRLFPAGWPTGIWRNPDFAKLWGSLTITHFGGQVTFLALPLIAALVLHATPFEVGILTAMGALPFPLFGLFAGVWVDRARKLPVIVAMDVGRGLALLAIPAFAVFHSLSMPLLYAVNFLVGLGSVIGWPAYQVFMTERVGRANLVEANAKIGIADSAAQLLGPGIAGALIQWLTAPFAILLDASGFFVSAWMLRGIPPRASDAPKARVRSMRHEIREGLRAVWRNPTLRALVWSVAVWQVLRHAFVAIVVLFGARALGFSAGRVGLLFMAAGVGSLVAAHATERLNRRYGMGPTMLGGLAGTGIAWLVIAGAAGPLWLASILFAGGLFLLDLTAMIFFINYLSLRQAASPDHQLGRVTATMIALTIALAPLGGVAGGWIADHLGLRAAMAIVGLGALLLVPLVAWLSPISRLRELPGTGEPAITESLAEETTF